MKGDFSRLIFNRTKRYTTVLKQQGRLDVDADHNEQQAIHQYRSETEAQDVIGQCGVPKSGGGFEVQGLDELITVLFLDSQRGWAIGQNATILATTNGGQTWTRQNSGISRGVSLFDGFFISAERGWAVGESGTILATTDGGQTWTRQNSGSTEGLSGVFFTNEQQGWAVGGDGLLLTTTNGGQTWTRQNSGISTDLSRVFFIDSQRGWMTGRAGVILATTNGGQTWTRQNSSVEADLVGISFADAQRGWIVGERGERETGTILMTTNGGQTWIAPDSGVPEMLWDVAFLNSERGWAVGNNGTLLSTTNGGANWSRQESGILDRLLGITFLNERQGWAVGGRGIILVTENGGNTWTAQLSANDFLISPGRLYVDGILCENSGALYTQQPDLPAAVLPEAIGTYLVYLDVWQRHLTALDDPLIREVAFNGPDTTTRLKTVWQVKLLEIEAFRLSDALALLRRVLDRLRELEATSSGGNTIAGLRSAQTEIETFLARFPQLRSQTRRLNLQRFLTSLQRTLQALIQEQDLNLQPEIEAIASEQIRLAEDDEATCDRAFPEWDSLTAPRTGSLTARTQPPEAEESLCLLPPSAGYQRLENQCYRVEIHQAGSLETATFKWSRDNGSVVTVIEQISGAQVTVADLGADEVLGFANGGWVELSDDRLELNGQPGQLRQISSINPATRAITLSAPPTPLADTPSGVDPAHHPKLRRWDQFGATATADGIALSGDWQTLEGGIQVQFSEGEYKTENYWLIPARTATGEIEWPPYQIPNLNPMPQPPQGIQHHYCRLGLLQLDDGGFTLQEDCRRVFPPLTEVPTTARAIHVLDTNWDNDATLSISQFRNNGLQITLDRAPLAVTVNAATLSVTIQLPSEDGGEAGVPISPLYALDGQITVTDNQIRWLPNPQQLPVVQRFLPRNRVGGLLWVKLHGHKIWSEVNGRQFYLDGQVFGSTGQRQDGSPRTALTFPSGADLRASDFESWLFLSQGIGILRLALRSPSVVGGTAVQGDIFLTDAAPTEGLQVNLSSNNAQIVQVPQTVRVEPGQTSGTFQATTTRVATNTSVDVTATLEGATVTTRLTVIPRATLTAVAVNPTSVQGGGVVQGTVTISSPAPPTGTLITLSSSNAQTAQVPATVRVASGQTAVSFEVRTRPVSGVNTTVRIGASFENVNRTAGLTVRGIPIG